MKRKSWLVLVCFCTINIATVAQEDSLSQENLLEEVIFSVNRWNQKVYEVPNKVVKITKAEILQNNPQTSADLLGQTGSVFIQKSQLGGGSPMIRGFATNRVLLVVDGIRMNNAIYRSGNLQNVISIDPLSIEKAEVIFGPGSLVYGSDAIGGVMNFRTLEPQLAEDNKMNITGSALARYSSANNENTGHIDLNVGWEKWSLLSSLTHSKFGDLTMGKNGGPDSYLRYEFVERENNNDRIVPNPNPRIQRFSGYEQLNILQKLRFRPSKYIDLQYSFTYAGTGKAPRYDRLLQYRNNNLRFAEWFYGPMLWRMHHLHLLHSKRNALYDEAKTTVAYQNYEESRIDRTFSNNYRTIQSEKVHAASINWDAAKRTAIGKLFYGFEYVFNKVGSTGERTNIETNSVTPYISRYPDGSQWSSSGIYGSYQINLHSKITLTAGLRYSYNWLRASFDTTFINFPYKQGSIRDGAFTGNTGFVFRPNESWQLNSTISSGYRMPNIDDIGKLFETVPGIVTVPNPDLQPEYAWNFEAGIVKKLKENARLEFNGFYSVLNNAIVRRPFTFNGSDSILFDGIISGVEALQNVAKATVWGIQASAEIWIHKKVLFRSNANWIRGYETDDLKNEQVPLRHAPPFYGSSFIRYQDKRWFVEASIFYNSEIKFKDMAPSEQLKTDIYAPDHNGNPYSPGWYTLNLKASYPVTKYLSITTGWENITNQRYRPYSSGIVAAGSNFILALRASLQDKPRKVK